MIPLISPLVRLFTLTDVSLNGDDCFSVRRTRALILLRLEYCYDLGFEVEIDVLGFHFGEEFR